MKENGLWIITNICLYLIPSKSYARGILLSRWWRLPPLWKWFFFPFLRRLTYNSLNHLKCNSLVRRALVSIWHFDDWVRPTLGFSKGYFRNRYDSATFIRSMRFGLLVKLLTHISYMDPIWTQAYKVSTTDAPIYT